MDEKTFFEYDCVKVAHARFVVDGQTFAMSNVTSVKPVTMSPKRLWGCWKSTSTSSWIGVMLSLTLFAGTSFAAVPPVPEIIHYQFDEAGILVTNRASSPPVNAGSATLMGGLTQGAPIAGTHLMAVVGSGNSSSTDYVNTGWATNLTGSAWSISFFSSEVAPSATLFYIMGDDSAESFRIFTNGVAGPNNWILRGTGITDVTLNNGAVMGTTMTTFVYDNAANDIKAYLNGVLQSTVAQAQPGPVISGIGPFKVVGYNTNVGLNAGGKLGDVRIYRHALSQAEVTEIYNAAFMRPQTLTFSPAPTVAVGASASVMATSASPNSGNLITYSTASSDCTVTSAGVVTGVHAGTDNCTITASQAGVTTLPGYDDGSATQTFSIVRAGPSTPASIPTLSECALIGLSSLTAMFGLALMRRRSL